MMKSGTPVLILKEGSSESKGRESQRNIYLRRQTHFRDHQVKLGSSGVDKMLVDSLGDVTITNDGATILKEIDVQHPAAKMIVEIPKTTDNEVGDGTTSAAVLAGPLLENAELINKEVHPTIIVDGYKRASWKTLEFLDKLAIQVPPTDKKWLQKIAKTSMASKLISGDSDHLSQLAVETLLPAADQGTCQDKYRVDLDNVQVEKKPRWLNERY